MKYFKEKILAPLFVGVTLALLSLLCNVFGDINELKQANAVNKSEHEIILERQSSMSKKIDALYWYLIERNNIALPERIKKRY
jgi:uncharacterized protein (DUF697 family)